MSKKKKILWIVFSLLMLVFVLNFVTGFWNKPDKEWGVSLKVENVTPTGLSYELKREHSVYEADFITGSDYWVQKRSFFHWTYMEKSRYSTLVAYPVTVDTPMKRDVDWEWRYGKLPMGMYRIGKDVSVEDLYRHPEEERENLERNFYCTFLVITWQGILSIVILAVLLIGTLWAIRRFHFDVQIERFIRKLIHMDRKKLVILGGLICFLLISVWTLFLELQGPIANYMQHIKIQIAESRDDELTGTLSFTSTKDSPKMRRGLGSVQKRTLFGWKEIGYYFGGNDYELLEIGAQDFSYDWGLYKVPVSEGRYRIRHDVDRLENGEWKRAGSYYIMFQVE